MGQHARAPPPARTHTPHLPTKMAAICAMNIVAKAATTGKVKTSQSKTYKDLGAAVKAGLVRGTAPFPRGHRRVRLLQRHLRGRGEALRGRRDHARAHLHARVSRLPRRRAGRELLFLFDSNVT